MKKRRKYKDNPYILESDGEKLFVKFKDSKNVINNIIVSKKIYEAFNQFELDDLKQLNEYDRHIEHYNLTEEKIYIRNGQSDNVEKIIEKNMLYDNLLMAIISLSKIQKRRIVKYYFLNKNEHQIAIEEHATHQSVHISLKRALCKLRENLKKYYF